MLAGRHCRALHLLAQSVDKAAPDTACVAATAGHAAVVPGPGLTKAPRATPLLHCHHSDTHLHCRCLPSPTPYVGSAHTIRLPGIIPSGHLTMTIAMALRSHTSNTRQAPTVYGTPQIQVPGYIASSSKPHGSTTPTSTGMSCVWQRTSTGLFANRIVDG